MLLVSMVIFYSIGLFDNGVTDVLIIILVILIHEAGHFIGMRLFGYKNIQMFFIPMFGAAISGRSKNVAAYKKALVALLGPVPGIFIGFLLGIVYAVTGIAIIQRMMIMFFVINIFNLLPFFPLDGGRFLHEALFSRNRYIELIFKILASLAMIAIGLTIGGWFLAVFGLFSLIGAQYPFKVARIANELKTAPDRTELTDNIDIFSAAQAMNEDSKEDIEPQPDEIPTEIAEKIIKKIPQHLGNKLNLKTVATYTEQVWERMNVRPPRLLATFGLVGVYFFCFFFALISISVVVAVSFRPRESVPESRIVEYQKPDGQTGSKEEVYMFGQLFYETELTDDNSLYHGRTILYDRSGSIVEKGWWHEGRRDGLWESYDPNGTTVETNAWDKGNFLYRKERENGEWIEKTLEDFPSEEQARFRLLIEGPPRGPLPSRKESGDEQQTTLLPGITEEPISGADP
jgi:Zn-dependent protease